jgi:hypothetical protein
MTLPAQEIGYANYQVALKVLYLNDVTIQDLVNDDNPLLAMLAKDTNFVADTLPQPVINSYNQGNSSVFGNALQNQNSGSIKKFVFTRFPIYGLATIDRQTMLASKGDKGAFLPAAEFAIDGAFTGLANQMSQALYGNGTGVIAQANGTIAAGIVNLVSLDSAVNFEVGMILDATTTNNSASLSNQVAGIANILVVDRNFGILTIAVATVSGTGVVYGTVAGTPAAWTASGLYLAQDGNLSAQPPGLAGWLPFVQPITGDNFYGVDRSVDPDRLAGTRYDGTSENVEEAVLSASAKLSKLSKAKPDALFVSPTVYNQFEKSLQGRAIYVEHKEGNIGFTGIKVMAVKGPVTVFQDRSNTTNFGYLLTMKHWKIRSLMACPHIVQDDITGNILRVSDADAFQVRLAGYWMLACEAPSANAVIQFQNV